VEKPLTLFKTQGTPEQDEFVLAQCLRQSICNLLGCRDVLEFNFALIDLLAYKVVLYIYMLCSGMELGVLS
jgi:hypothetical protein